ncbi:MAG: 2-oxo acid dehydrogenase subunit E2 [Nevskiaceae bacterium]|nr:MAG: 2-oxo acid dehydrogenase subunit E2 [Nevskiaceae bacterium]TBR72690.1 MAG: 2-oxo acid dehydrogenase subunit E2 [Nevskiaceae bacterium]
MSDIVEIHMPKLGESVAEGTISEWLKAVGDSVDFDESLFVVETDKIATEFPSPEAGVLLEILVPAGETVPIGATLARIGPAGAATGASPAAAKPADAAAAKAAAMAAEVAEPATAAAPATASAAPAAHKGGELLSPLVRRLAAEHHLDLAQIAGSGANGRIMREDVEAAIRKQLQPAVSKVAIPPVAPVSASSSPASPPAAKGDKVVPLSRIRLVTAQRMVESKRIAPHVWTSVEVDYENIAKVRARHKDRFKAETGASLTYLPFVMRAVADALHAFPAVNSSVDIEAKTLIMHSEVHLAVAVDLDEKGLMAPVIRNADMFNVRGLAKAVQAVSAAAKKGTLTPDQLQGSTFTLTSPGPLGSFASAPIINQPNVAIMATDGVARKPTVVGDAIAIHHLGVLGLCYDHRAFDGVTTARFLDHVRTSLQERDWEAEIG